MLTCLTQLIIRLISQGSSENLVSQWMNKCVVTPKDIKYLCCCPWIEEFTLAISFNLTSPLPLPPVFPVWWECVDTPLWGYIQFCSWKSCCLQSTDFLPLPSPLLEILWTIETTSGIPSINATKGNIDMPLTQLVQPAVQDSFEGIPTQIGQLS